MNNWEESLKEQVESFTYQISETEAIINMIKTEIHQIAKEIYEYNFLCSSCEYRLKKQLNEMLEEREITTI